MSNEIVLFIGGPLDGKRKAVPEYQIEIRAMDFQPEGIKEHIYTRRRFRSGEVELWALVHSKISDDELMRVLLDGYKKP